ncbi:hypothetical protein AB0399_14885 [Streptomyces sp. NPDC088194]|uniref:hypothetical protein n=1 Tax=Streptomyces sp. NPDC088194 TaxID=3154931 RepID=UPI0034504810
MQGVDALLTAGQRLEFRWAGGNQLSMAPEACVAVYGHPFGREGGLRLVFRFRPGDAGPNDGHVTVSAVIGPEHAEDAWRFVQTLVGVYGIEDAAWTDGSKVVAERPARIPPDDPDWLAAPASPPTEALLCWVTRRLTDADV